MELYARVRRACMVEGMSTREAARMSGLHRDTVRKMLRYSVPPGYRRQSPPRRLHHRRLPGTRADRGQGRAAAAQPPEEARPAQAADHR